MKKKTGRPVGWRKEDGARRETIAIRIEDDLLEALDAACGGGRQRSGYIRRLLRAVLLPNAKA